MSSESVMFQGWGHTYPHNATTKARRVMLLEGQKCTDILHMGEWMAQYVLGVCHIYCTSSKLLLTTDSSLRCWTPSVGHSFVLSPQTILAILVSDGKYSAASSRQC